MSSREMVAMRFKVGLLFTKLQSLPNQTAAGEASKKKTNAAETIFIFAFFEVSPVKTAKKANPPNAAKSAPLV